MKLYALIAIFTDNCTYTIDVFCGVFRTRELASTAQNDWIIKHKDEESPEDFQILEIEVDEVL